MTDKNRRVAVVTGGNKGIGFEIVKRLCKEFDGDVILTARNAEKGQTAVANLEKLNLKVHFHQLDIEDDESIEKLAQFLKDTYGGLDVLVNSAGTVVDVDKKTSIEKAATDTIRINFTRTLKVCEVLFPLLRSNARVVNMSSRYGFLYFMKNKELKRKFADKNASIKAIEQLMNDYLRACKNGTQKKEGWAKDPYKVSKAGVNAVTSIQQTNIDQDTSRSGIIISCVGPGYCKTDLTNQWGFLTPAQGAETPVFLALLPKDFKGPRGAFWAEDKPMKWETDNAYWKSLGMEFCRERSQAINERLPNTNEITRHVFVDVLFFKTGNI